MKKQPTINPNDFVSVESGSEDVYVPLNEEIEVYDVNEALDEINGVVVAGSTEDKVEYLDETKTDIREAIINKGVEVGEDDPFRSYAEKIDDIAGGVHNQDKTITENGTYTYDEGYTGLGEVVVEVPSEEPVLETLNVSANGTYTPSGNVDGYDEVVVDVPQATFEGLSVTENGVYEPTTADGYNRVEVDVNPPLQDKTITTNGTFTADSGYYGLDEVTVDIDTVNNQDKTITENGTYTADSGYTGLGTVIVNTPVVNNENKTIRVNGTYTAGAGYTGLGEVVVDVEDIPAVVEPLSVSPTTSQQIITPPANVDGFNQVTVSAVTSSIDANISAGNIKSGVSILGVQGSVVELDGETTTVSPTTSQQVITPTGQHNGLTEVTIEAVDASIDSDIVAGNIKSGVNILGVSGSVVELNADSLSVTPTTSAQTITPTRPYNAFNEVSVGAVTSSIDSNITAGNIKSGVSILGVAGSVEELNGLSLTVTPSTSDQWIQPQGDYNAFDDVFVNAVDSTIDSNIQAGNIKSGVTILGVQGTYTGGGITPTGTKNITENGVYDITNYASVDVAVPTTAPTYYVPKAVDANGKLVNSGSYLIDFTNINSIGLRALSYAYMNASFSANTAIDMSSVITLENAACEAAFYGCSGITTVDMSSITIIPNSACRTMFSQSSITSIDIGAETVGYMGCYGICNGCTGLTYANLGLLRTFSDSSAFDGAFYGCGLLAGVNVSSVEDVNKTYVFRQAFYGCSALTTVIWSSLTEATGENALSGAFSYSGITSLFFPSLSSTGFGTKTNQFQSMLFRVSGCTVHFPSNLQSVIGSWSDVQNGFGGTNTTVLFDLPATVTLVGTNSYYRNPKYDTATALAWFDTSATRATPYYTSGTTDPVVNDAIYSDAGCTTQVDTIASIS